MVGMQRPAEIINRGSLDATPTLLRAALATGIVTTLGLTLVASVSRRKRDLALLKALGFTKAQLAAATSWQSTMAVAIGAVVGIPLGIILGRFQRSVFLPTCYPNSAGCSFEVANRGG